MFLTGYNNNKIVKTWRAAMINLKIMGIALDQKTRMPIAILKTAGGERFIPIWIGPFEASAIIIRMEGVFPPRPLTHDVLTNFLNEFAIIRCVY